MIEKITSAFLPLHQRRTNLQLACLLAFLLSCHPAFSQTTYYTSIACTTAVNWNNSNAWSTVCGGAGGAGVPTATDTVVICGGHAVTMNGNPGSCAKLTISGTATWGATRTTNVGSGGLILTGGSITGSRTGILNVSGPCTVPSGTFNLGRVDLNISGTTSIISTINITSTLGTKTFTDITLSGTLNNSASTQLDINGNLVNNGTLTLNTGIVVFGGSSDATITGTSTTDFATVTMNKGTNYNTILDVQSLITMSTGGLTLTNGTFKLSSASTITPFPADIEAAPYLIPFTAGLWCNGGTINSDPALTSDVVNDPLAGNWTVAGLLRISAGTVNLGNYADQRFRAVNGGTTVLTVEGGTFNVAGRISRATATDNITFTMMGGNIIVPTVGSTAAGSAPVMIDQAGSTFNMSGGTIIIERPGAGNLGFTATAGTVGITGGTLQIGDASTPPSQTIQINSSFSIANLLVNNSTVTAQLAANLGVLQSITISAGTLNANNLNITLGNSWTNNGSFTEGTGSLTCDGTGTQTITNPSGETFYNFSINKPSGTVSLATNVTVSNALTMSGGNCICNGYQLTLGTGIVTPGTLTYAAGTIVGNFKRWITATGTNYLFPIGTSSYYRPALVNFTVLISGTLTASFVSSDPGSNGLPYSDGATTVQNQYTEGYWDLAAADGLSSTDYYIECTGTGFTSYAIGASTRLMYRATSGNPWSANGTHADASGSTAKRTGVIGLSSQFAFGKPPCSSYAAASVSGDTTVCTNQTGVAYSVNASNPPNTYNWTITGGSIASGQGTPNITVDWGGTTMDNANVQVIEQNNCGDNNSPINRNIWINPIATSVISGPTTVAQNETGTVYYLANTPEYSYSWTLPGGGGAINPPSSGVGVDSVTINWGPTAGIYSVRVDATRLCGTPDFQTLSVDVRATIQSAAGCATSCNWTNGNSWIGGTAPTANDYVEIQSGHTVVVNQSTAQCRKLTINGNTQWNLNRTLTVGDQGIVINSTGNLTGTGAGTCISQGGLTGINNSNISNTNLNIVLQTNNQEITSYGALNQLQITGVIVTNTDTLTIANNGTLSGTGTLAQSANSSLNMQGSTFLVTGFDASAAGNYVFYNANGNQTVRSGTYNNLSSGGTGTKTLGGNTTVNGDLTISGVTLDASTNNYSLDVAGNWTNTGTYNPRFNTTTFNGGSTQTITSSSGETFNNLNMTGSGTKVLAGNVAINFDFTLNTSLSVGDYDIDIKGNWDNSGSYTATTNNDVTFSNSSIVSGSSQTNFRNVAITGTLTGHSSNMNVSGNWSNNGTFNHNNGNVTFNGTTTVSGASTTTFKDVTITGSLTGHSSSMNVAGNWTNNGTYNHNNGTLVFNGSTLQTIGGAVASETYRNLTINNSNGATLGHTGNLLGTLTLTSGTFNISGQSFTVVSNASGTGRIGTIPPGGGTISGNFAMQRYVNGADGWRMLASPVTGTDIEGWDDNMITAGIPGSDYPAFSWKSLYFYDESQSGTKDAGWTLPSSTGASMAAGTGLFAFMSDVLGNPITTTLDQSGSLTNGSQVINVNYTDDPGQPDSEDGWNLIGNPFPSDIDWSLVTRSANVTAFAYVWNENTSSYVTYDAGAPAGTNSIASHQAFWLKASGGSGTVTINEDDKSTELQPFYKLTGNPSPAIVFSLEKNTLISTAEIRLRDTASMNYEMNLDAFWLKSLSPDAPNICSLSDDSVELAINTIPSSFSGLSIPVAIQCDSPGTFTLNFTLRDFSESFCLFLEDLITGDLIDIRTTNPVSVNISSPLTQTRFILHIGSPLDRQVSQPYCYGVHNGSVILTPQSPGPWTYTWKDESGNVLKTTSGNYSSDTLSNLAPGRYMAEVSGSSSVCPVNYDTIVIEEPLVSVELFADVTPPTCFENSDGAIDMMVQGSAPPFNYLWSDGSTTEDRTALQPGTYSVIVTDENNCPASGTYAIVPPEKVIASFSVSSDTVYISEGGMSTFSNTSAGGDIFTWDFGDGSPNDSSANPQHIYADSGNYLVSLSVSNEYCSNMNSQTITVLPDKPGAIGEDAVRRISYGQLVVDRISKDKLLLTYYFIHPENISLEVTDVLGKVINSARYSSLSNGSAIIMLDGCSEGVYLLKVTLEQRIMIYRFVR